MLVWDDVHAFPFLLQDVDVLALSRAALLRGGRVRDHTFRVSCRAIFHAPSRADLHTHSGVNFRSTGADDHIVGRCNGLHRNLQGLALLEL